ncbi:MAG: hypothetical protein QM689_02625 [Oscillospiraceae bacterium]
MRKTSKLKFAVYRKYPRIYNFMFSAAGETDEEVRAELEHRSSKAVTDGMNQLCGNIDLSKFRDGIPIEKAVNIIIWTFEGFANRIFAAGNDPMDEQNYARLYDEAMRYLDLLENCLYKQEEAGYECH